MKNLITILILLVGCATTPTMKSVVGSYEPKLGKDARKLIFLDAAESDDDIDPNTYSKEEFKKLNKKWKKLAKF